MRMRMMLIMIIIIIILMMMMVISLGRICCSMLMLAYCVRCVLSIGGAGHFARR